MTSDEDRRRVVAEARAYLERAREVYTPGINSEPEPPPVAGNVVTFAPSRDRGPPPLTKGREAKLDTPPERRLSRREVQIQIESAVIAERSARISENGQTSQQIVEVAKAATALADAVGAKLAAVTTKLARLETEIAELRAAITERTVRGEPASLARPAKH
jgi:hypothetical protein